MNTDVIIRGSRTWPLLWIVLMGSGIATLSLGPAALILPRSLIMLMIALQVVGLAWALAVIVKPNRLVIGDSGFTIEPSLAKPRTIAWADVEAIPARDPSRRTGLSWTPREEALVPAFMIRRTTSGRSAWMPGLWAVPMGEVLTQMQTRLAKARG